MTRILAAGVLLTSFAFALAQFWPGRVQITPALVVDNRESVAVIIGNRTYQHAAPAEYAHNDAAAIKAYLTGVLGFAEHNLIVELDATVAVFNDIFGSQGQLAARLHPNRSNVFVFYSGHGVMDAATRDMVLLTADAHPDQPHTGFGLEALYANLEPIKQKVGANRQVIVMIEAGFNGETGRGESLVTVPPQPDHVPLAPRNGNGLIKLVATSGAQRAHWDDRTKLSLFTSRFLLGLAGLAVPSGPGTARAINWNELRDYVSETVDADARLLSNREQVPDIAEASLSLPIGEVAAVAPVRREVSDVLEWQKAETAGGPAAYEAYLAACTKNGCGFLREAGAKFAEFQREATVAPALPGRMERVFQEPSALGAPPAGPPVDSSGPPQPPAVAAAVPPDAENNPERRIALLGEPPPIPRPAPTNVRAGDARAGRLPPLPRTDPRAISRPALPAIAASDAKPADASTEPEPVRLAAIAPAEPQNELLPVPDPMRAEPRRPESSFRAFIEGLWPEAETKGISRRTFDAALRGVEPDLTLTDLDLPSRAAAPPRGQAEFVQTPADYLKEASIARLAEQGKRLAAQHRTTLAAIEEQFGVPPNVLLAIWGRETAFGGHRLAKNAFVVLATQAYYGRRKDMFRQELLAALRMVEEGHAKLADMKSSWGGAMGLTQFLPTEFYKHGIDFDRDGKVDIFHSVPDALASAAKQLADKGWKRGIRWAYEVRTPREVDCTIGVPEQKQPLSEWLNKHNYVPAHGRRPSERELGEQASLLLPEGTYGPAFLTLSNYYVIKDYNFSDLYVLFVGYLSDRISDPRGFERPWSKNSQLRTDQVEAMQRTLDRLGFYKDKPDGKAGMLTRSALGAYQKANGLNVDCWPTAAVLGHMQARARP